MSGSGGPEDDVDTRVGVDDAGHLTDRKRKRRVLEGLLHGAFPKSAEVAAVAAQRRHSNVSPDSKGERQGTKRGGLKISLRFIVFYRSAGSGAEQPFSNVSEWGYPDTVC